MADDDRSMVKTHMKPGQELRLASVVARGCEKRTVEELERLCSLAGVDFTHEINENSTLEGILRFDVDSERPFIVVARFHDLFAPYFARGSITLNLRDDAADALELISAVGSTIRGKVVGVLGAHGGSGVSTLSAWMARLTVPHATGVGLIDLDPSSWGIDRRLGIEDEPGHRWRDLQGRGALLSGQVVDTLPVWNGVRVVSADDRPGVDLDDSRAGGSRVICAVSQVCEWTFVDLGVYDGRESQREWIEWCDLVVVVHAMDVLSLHSAGRVVEAVGGSVRLVVVGVGCGSKNEAAHAAIRVGVDAVFPVRKMAGARGDIDHGVVPGDRASSGVARDVKKLVSHIHEMDFA